MISYRFNIFIQEGLNQHIISYMESQSILIWKDQAPSGPSPGPTQNISKNHSICHHVHHQPLHWKDFWTPDKMFPGLWVLVPSSAGPSGRAMNAWVVGGPGSIESQCYICSPQNSSGTGQKKSEGRDLVQTEWAISALQRCKGEWNWAHCLCIISLVHNFGENASFQLIIDL